ncbi:molybdopterin-dependent oxidoreductase [Cupriavidus necator]
MNDPSRNIRKTITASHWGAGVVETVGGQIQSVAPYRDDPNPSRINENIADSLQGTARVLRPSIREGYLRNGSLSRLGVRGKDRYVEVSWDAALNLVSEELLRVRSTHGNEAIFAGSYGWASAGRFHHAQGQLKRFLNAFGGSVRSEGNYSFNAALVLMPHIVGNFRDHVKQATRWRTVAKEGRLVVMFGGLPLRNAQVGSGGVGKHRLRRELENCVQAGVRFINISPFRGDAEDFLEAEWLPPTPGSDTAIMMGIAHTLLSEGLVDRSFLDRYTVGFEKVESYLRGEPDGQPKDADWAAKQSGLPATRIRTLAREMAAQRTLICTAAALQRADYGEQPLWMTVALASMLGQIGLPGGGYGIAYASEATMGCVDRPIGWPAFPQGENPVETYIPVAMIADMLLHPGEAYEYNGQKMQFPDARLVWWAGGNPFHHHQDLNRLRQAFQRPETIIVNEINWTATARHADIVLPVAAPLERTDFCGGTQDNSLIPMPQAVSAPGEARCEYDIYCDLEKRLGLGMQFSEGLSSSEWLERMWSELQGNAERSGIELPDWEDFLSGDVIELEDRNKDAVFLSDFRSEPNRFSLPTPSGKIELASDVIAGFGYSDCPGHPTWFPPRAWQSSTAKQFPLSLLSGQPETRLHSQLDNGAFSLSRKVQGREPILIHPQDAEARDIAHGDIVEVMNEYGRCLAGAVVTPQIKPGVVFLCTGAWYDPDFSAPDSRDRHGNPNVLTHDLRTSRLAQGPASHSARVEIAKFKESVPRIEVFDAPVITNPA